MPIVGGLDIPPEADHLRLPDTVTGKVRRGQVSTADWVQLRAWLALFAGRGDAAFALEACIAWRYVAEELAAAGITVHLAEPVGLDYWILPGWTSR
jgi:transposase